MAWSARFGATSYKTWPQYVYHFTDLQNALGIIRSKSILCRDEAVRRGLMKNDNASPTVIAQTNAAHKRYARFYFRPLTPTQFRNEGIKPLCERYHTAHCPIPIFFCLDLVQTIARDGTEFSNGNMGSQRTDLEHGDSLELFRRLPFEEIYHDGPYKPAQYPDRTFHRNAEVLVPTELPLAGLLKMIVVRSAAERATLLHHLSPAERALYEPLVRETTAPMFQRLAAHVERVTPLPAQRGNPETIEFAFNPGNRCETPHVLEFEYQEADRRTWTWPTPTSPKEPQWCRETLRLSIEGARRGRARLMIDGCLACECELDFRTLPF